MRQTLFRIVLDGRWVFESRDGIDFVGVGFLLIPWALYVLWWGFQNSRQTKRLRDAIITPVIGLLIGGVVILAIPSLASGRVSPNGIPVYGYGFMMFLGFFVAAWQGARRAPAVGIESEVIWDLAVWIFFASVVGARLFYILQYPKRVFYTFQEGQLVVKQGSELLFAAFNLPDGGIVFYGGVIAVAVAFFVFCRRRQLNVLFMADFVLPSAFIGLIFGRIGCLLNGCCYGDRSGLPWAITFPQGSVPYMSLVHLGILSENASGTFPLHPSQIYSSINALMISLLLGAYFKYRQRDGAVLALTLFIYPASRFVLEILRGDESGQFDTTLTISQWVSIVMFTLGLIFWTWLVRQPVSVTRVIATPKITSSSSASSAA